MQSSTIKLLASFVLLVYSIPLSAQCIDGDCVNGNGIYIYKDQTIFIGKFLSGKANGYGTCYYSSGAKYSGNWLEHEYHGEGTYIYPDQSVEFGNWAFGKLETKEEWIDTTENRASKTWALVIGVANYTHLTPLNFTDDDAYRMNEFLKSEAGGGLEKSQITLLIDENATKAKIIQSLHDLTTKVGKNDKFIFYFSGHGFEDALAPVDIKQNENKLYHKEIISLINSNFAAQRLCIIDACHSGSMAKISKSKVSDAYYQKFKAKTNTAFIFSSQAKEASIENRGLRQGIFSHFLLKGLNGEADSDENNQVTIDEVANYVKEQVRIYTENYQHPTIINTVNNASVIAELK